MKQPDRDRTRRLERHGAGVILKTFNTNAEAWRWIDRRQGDIVSRSEAVSDWIWSKKGSAMDT